MRFSFTRPRLSRVPWRTAASEATVLAHRFGVVSVFLLGAFGLSRVDYQAAGPARDELAEPGLIDRFEVLNVWLPQALLDLARRGDGLATGGTPEELRACLERNGLGNAWYALRYRGHQTNGGAQDITLVGRTDGSTTPFRTVQDVMLLAAGRPPQGPSMDFSDATISVIPDRMLTADPREAVEELIRFTSDHTEKSTLPASHSDRPRN